MASHSRSLLLAQFGAVCLLAVLHLSGAAFGWYDRFIWYDIPMHLVGGVWAGLAVLWVARREGLQLSFFRVVALVLAIGIAWELFEFFAKVPQHAGYALDTLKDLADDVVGGIVAVWFSRRIPVDELAPEAYGEANGTEIHELPGISA